MTQTETAAMTADLLQAQIDADAELLARRWAKQVGMSMECFANELIARLSYGVPAEFADITLEVFHATQRILAPTRQAAPVAVPDAETLRWIDDHDAYYMLAAAT